MSALLFIPWFQAEPLLIPYPAWLPPITGFGHHLPIQPFGLLVAIGVVVGYRVAERRAVRAGIAVTTFSDLTMHCLVGGFVGGHMLDSLFYHWPHVVADPLYVLRLWEGLSSFGGFIGALVGAVVWKLRRRASFLAVGDPIAFGLPFGWFFGRMGCFVVHDHPGAVTTFPLAVADYHVGQPPFQTRHDLGLYEVLFCVVLVPLLLWLGRRQRPPGFFLGVISVCYAPVRFGLDFLRARSEEVGDVADPRTLGLTPAQYASIVLLVAGVGILLYIASRGQSSKESAPENLVHRALP